MNHSSINREDFTAAVEHFSERHDANAFAPGQKKYSELLPARKPGEGQQYAFEVDLDKCTGCKSCVTACHNENGLDVEETWRSVGLIHGGTSANPGIQHVTGACHHCAEPACLQGCPTLAYTKDPETGIVKHLDDQCFGCQYCILKCPYDVPQYSKKRGIVHKCDMCVDRLTAGQAPACVRACPNGAIRITVVDQQAVKNNSQQYVLIPGAPASDYTYPTTRYTTNRIFPRNMEPADQWSIKPEHAHTPLVVMLVLSQLSVGAFFMGLFLSTLFGASASGIQTKLHSLIALGFGLIGLGASLAHLGRPHLAFRAFLGFKTSWLSREIIALGLFAHAAMFYVAVLWFPPLQEFINQSLPLFGGTTLGWAVTAAGIVGIFSSVMVYRDTRQPFWDHPRTTVKFYATAVILGSCTTLLTYVMISIFNGMQPAFPAYPRVIATLATVILLGTSIKLISEAVLFFTLKQKGIGTLKKTALLMMGPLKNLSYLRFSTSFIGGIILPFILLFQHSAPSEIVIFLSGMIFLLCLAGELSERYLFFKALVRLKMPGGYLQ